MRERMRTPDTNSIAVARAQQVDDEWDTMVAVFDRVMATTDPHQLKAARAAWARGEKEAMGASPAADLDELLEQPETDPATQDPT